MPLPFTDEAAWRGAPLIADADRADVERRGRQVWTDCARTGEATPQDVPGFLRTRRLSARRRSLRVDAVASAHPR